MRDGCDLVHVFLVDWLDFVNIMSGPMEPSSLLHGRRMNGGSPKADIAIERFCIVWLLQRYDGCVVPWINDFAS